MYNALGERAERNVGGTYTEYLYDKDGSEVGENNRTSWTETWAAFQGRHLFHFSGGSTYFTHTDSLGTTSIVTDYSTGAVVQDELHYPWGQQWAMLGTMQEERFAHLHHRDNETSLDPTLNRMYSSDEARWMTPDPLTGSLIRPQSLNRYAYVESNPINAFDPLGLYLVMKGGCVYNRTDFYVDGQYDSSTDDFVGCDFSGGQIGGALDLVKQGGGSRTPPPSPPPQTPPPSPAQAIIQGQYQQWCACRLDEMRSELGAKMIEHALNLENPSPAADVVDATLSAGETCLRMFPLAALDPAYNGPAPGNVF